jgi:hypothetical protein
MFFHNKAQTIRREREFHGKVENTLISFLYRWMIQHINGKETFLRIFLEGNIFLNPSRNDTRKFTETFPLTNPFIFIRNVTVKKNKVIFYRIFVQNQMLPNHKAALNKLNTWKNPHEEEKKLNGKY